MNPALQRYLEAASGITSLTKARAEQIARQLAKQGEVASDNVGELVDDLMERQRRNRETVAALVRSETQRVVRAMGLATTSEVERLEQQVADLEQRLATAGSAAKKSASKKSAAKRSASKKSTSKKSAAKRSTSKKSASKRSAAKKRTS